MAKVCRAEYSVKFESLQRIKETTYDQQKKCLRAKAILGAHTGSGIVCVPKNKNGKLHNSQGTG